MDIVNTVELHVFLHPVVLSGHSYCRAIPTPGSPDWTLSLFASITLYAFVCEKAKFILTSQFCLLCKIFAHEGEGHSTVWWEKNVKMVLQ